MAHTLNTTSCFPLPLSPKINVDVINMTLKNNTDIGGRGGGVT